MIKSIECNPNGCGTRFSIPSSEIKHEHLEECIKNGWQYREAIIEQEGNITIIKCPECKKEAIRYWH